MKYAPTLAALLPLLSLSALAESSPEVNAQVRPIALLEPVDNAFHKQCLLLSLRSSLPLTAGFMNRPEVKLDCAAPINLPYGYASTKGDFVLLMLNPKKNGELLPTHIKSELEFSSTAKPLTSSKHNIEASGKGSFSLNGKTLNYQRSANSLQFTSDKQIPIRKVELFDKEGKPIDVNSSSYSISSRSTNYSVSPQQAELPKVRSCEIHYYPGKLIETTLPLDIKLPLPKDKKKKAGYSYRGTTVETAFGRQIYDCWFELSPQSGETLLMLKDNFSFNQSDWSTPSQTQYRKTDTGSLYFTIRNSTLTKAPQKVKRSIEVISNSKPLEKKSFKLNAATGSIEHKGTKISYKWQPDTFNKEKKRFTLEFEGELIIKDISFSDATGKAIKIENSMQSGLSEISYSFKAGDEAKIKAIEITYYPGPYKTTEIEIDQTIK